MGKRHTCPICHRTFRVPSGKDQPPSPNFPFCSERCRLIDLGSWLDGRYKIVSPLEPEDAAPHREDEEE
jgi:endogenous inhibitor of DNA gyrase (YacG/DUF329 family)